MQLLSRFPVLNNAVPPHSLDRVLHYGTHTARKRGFVDLLCDGFWAVVTIRPRFASSKSNKRVLMRAGCTSLSCAKRHWWCVPPGRRPSGAPSSSQQGRWPPIWEECRMVSDSST